MNNRNITLVTRNVNCGSMTSEEFVKMMFNDILEAIENYDTLYTPEYVESELNHMKYNLHCVEMKATRFAEKKWKTEKKRSEYINKEVDAARKNITNNISTYYPGISFFDFDVNPGKNGLSGNCCLSTSNLTAKALERCFNEVKDNEYFKAASGWYLTYEASENSYRNAFRPHIELILSEEMKAKMDAERKTLEDAIREFYRGSNYTGD